MERIFILSPARTDGKHAAMAMNPAAQFDLARRLRTQTGAPLGEVFSFLSGLYFRGKLAYANRFARAPAGHSCCSVITSNAGLVCASSTTTVETLLGFAGAPIELSNPQYLAPLARSARELLDVLPSDAEVVLLGSIATPKYVEPLRKCFGTRLVFPTEFIGRGI